LNGQPSVRQETRQRVIEAMQTLNYRRNFAARALVTRRSHTVGIVGFDTTLFGPARMLYSVEDAAWRAGYLVSIATVRELTRQQVVDAVDRLTQHAVDGVIAIAPNQAMTRALAEAPARLRCVAVGGAGESDAALRVSIDNVTGARLATQHLLDLGHRTVHHAAGPLDWPEARARLDGWRATLAAAGRPIPPVATGWWDAESGYEHGRRLAPDPGVTAVFCANDRIALGLLRAFHEAGRRIPADVSVVGFDDTPEAGFFHPPLTTVRQDFEELGRRSLELLLGHMGVSEMTDSPDHVLVPPDLVVRASSGPRSPGA
jgi:DNA-binding LacI/PurR family transcriptional regulator